MAQATADEIRNKRNIDQGKKTSRDGKSSGSSEESDNQKNSGPKIDALGYLLFFFLLCFAVAIDVLPYFTSGLSAVLDWILDIAFWLAVTFSMMLATGDILGSLFGKRQLINALQTVLESLPLIDILPFHAMAVIIIFLDLQFNILNKLPTKPKTSNQ